MNEYLRNNNFSAESELLEIYDKGGWYEYGSGIKWWRTFKCNKKVGKWDNSVAAYKLIDMADALEQGYDAGRYAKYWGENWEKEYL